MGCVFVFRTSWCVEVLGSYICFANPFADFQWVAVLFPARRGAGGFWDVFISQTALQIFSGLRFWYVTRRVALRLWDDIFVSQTVLQILSGLRFCVRVS